MEYTRPQATVPDERDAPLGFDRNSGTQSGARHRGWLRSAESRLGRWQLETANRALLGFAGLKAGRIVVHHPHDSSRLEVAYVSRRLRAARGRTPLVFLHGFGDSKETWLPMVAALGRGRPLLLLDLPGFGDSTKIPGELATVRRQSAAVYGVLCALGLREVDLVGHSLGGGIALELAYRHPECVRSLSLLSSVGPEVTRSALSHQLEHGMNPLAPRTLDQAEQMFDWFMHKPGSIPRPIVRYVAEERLRMGPYLETLFDNVLPELREAVPTVPQLAQISAPCLVVCGLKDRIIHPDTSRGLVEHLPHARLVELSDIGHTISLEATWSTARLLSAFLRTARV